MLLEHLSRHLEDAAAPPATWSVEELEEAIAIGEAAADEQGVQLPLPNLVRRFGLSRTDRDLLLLAVARAVAPGTAQLVSLALGAPAVDVPTVGLATALLGGDPVFVPPPDTLFGARSRT